MVVVTVDATALRARIQQFGADVMSDALDAMPDQMRPYAPIGKSATAGQLRESIQRDRGTFDAGGPVVRGRIIAPVIQAKTTDQGSPAHPIYPRKIGGLLVFEIDGRTIFTTYVNHPGNAARPWWETALRASFGPQLRFAALARSSR